MSYRIDPCPTAVGRSPLGQHRETTIVLVGCGGTGGFLAEAICRLLLGRNAQLYLVDPDRVEPHNVARQCFDRGDVNRFKVEVLAERLSRRFGREVGYSALPFERELHTQVFCDARTGLNLLVGCVDNSPARRAIAAAIDQPGWRDGYQSGRTWWLDTGNARNSGQVLLGNVTRPESLRGAFVPAAGLCRALPAPSLQRPDLLDTPPEPRPQADCAEAVAAGDQGPTVNQVVAALAASYVAKLLDGACSWMASYFDLDDGTLRCVPADPKTVAAIAGLHPNAVAPPSHRG